MSSLQLSKYINRDRFQELRPGVLAAFALGAVAVFLSRGLGGVFAQSPLLIAIIVGLLIGSSFGTPAALDPGLTFVVKKILRLSVALVGFRVTLQQVADIGLLPFLIAAVVLSATYFFTLWLARKVFKVEDEMAHVLAAGTSVCGASAILAVAAIIKPQPRQATVGITLITLLGTVTLLSYPLLYVSGLLPGLTDHTYGIFIGSTIYEVAQVVGAGYSVSEAAGNTAVVIKLSKVLMLIPLLIILGIHQRRQEPDRESAPPLIPWFVVAFVVLLLINTLSVIPSLWVDGINQANVFLLTAVMVALGLRTPVSRLQTLRWAMRPTLASLVIFVFGIMLGYTLVWGSTPFLGEVEATSNPGYSAAALSGGSTQITAGEAIFIDIGCAKCHVPTLTTADGRPVHLYSDLLLHDLGPALDDKVVQGEATGREWRTTPLWGLGSRHQYLHDGRARTIHDAIVAHGGEAAVVTSRYTSLTPEEVEALTAFLQSR